MVVLKGRVVDGNGGQPIEDGLVVIENDRITAVCRQGEFEVPERVRVLQVEDGTIMPGLVDLHVHLALSSNFYEVYQRHPYAVVCTAVNDMKKILDAGFTSIRECGGLSNYLKAPQQAGEIDGPRIFSAGKCFVQTGGHFDFIKQFPVEYTKHPERNVISQVVDGINEVRRESRKHFREGADFLKVMVTPGVVSQSAKFHVQEFCDEEIRAFVEEADKYGTYVAVHAHANKGIKAALRCGVKCIEHGTFMEEDDAEEMYRQGIWYVPTMATGYQFRQNLSRLNPWVQEKEKMAAGAGERSIRMAYEAGVKMGCGADFGGDEFCPHGLNGLELKLLCDYTGMSPMEAIVAATKTGAEIMLCGDDLGTLEAGKLADVILVRGNPLKDISLVVGPQNIAAVVQNGNVKKDRTAAVV